MPGLPGLRRRIDLRKTVNLSGTRCYDERPYYPLQHWLYYARRYTQTSYRAGWHYPLRRHSPVNTQEIGMPQHTVTFGTTRRDPILCQIKLGPPLRRSRFDYLSSFQCCADCGLLQSRYTRFQQVPGVTRIVDAKAAVFNSDKDIVP